jgi:hypothetical protein
MASVRACVSARWPNACGWPRQNSRRGAHAPDVVGWGKKHPDHGGSPWGGLSEGYPWEIPPGGSPWGLRRRDTSTGYPWGIPQGFLLGDPPWGSPRGVPLRDPPGGGDSPWGGFPWAPAPTRPGWPNRASLLAGDQTIGAWLGALTVRSTTGISSMCLKVLRA